MNGKLISNVMETMMIILILPVFMNDLPTLLYTNHLDCIFLFHILGGIFFTPTSCKFFFTLTDNMYDCLPSQ